VRGTGHGVRGMWYEIRGTWCRAHGTGHSRAQMNNKDIIFVHMAYSRLDWSSPARWGAGELNTPVLLLFLILIF